LRRNSVFFSDESQFDLEAVASKIDKFIIIGQYHSKHENIISKVENTACKNPIIQQLLFYDFPNGL